MRDAEALPNGKTFSRIVFNFWNYLNKDPKRRKNKTMKRGICSDKNLSSHKRKGITNGKETEIQRKPEFC